MSFIQDTLGAVFGFQESSLQQQEQEAGPTMKAIVWESEGYVSLADKPKPTIDEPDDAIIRITSSALCGSDLYLLHQYLSGVERGDIMGHEAMGIVESVGSNVRHFSVGDKVIISSLLSDGTCKNCKAGWPDCCEANDNESGGVKHNGVFAEYTQVPFADYNLLKVPNYLPDEKVLFLAESLTAAWHACENAGINTDTESIAVFGCGPVGLYAIMWIKNVLAPSSYIVAVDSVPSRRTKSMKLGASASVDPSSEDVLQRLNDLFPNGSPDVCIDAVGMKHAPRSMLSTVEWALGLETELPQVISMCIAAVKKRGTISIVGDYNAPIEEFPLGELFRKGITLKTGVVPVQRYWHRLLEYIDQGLIDPTQLVTHYFSLDQSREAFSTFESRDHGAIKVLIQPYMPFSSP